MNARYAVGSTLRIAGLGLCALAIVSWVFYGALAREPGRQVTLHETVRSTWQQADGPIAAGDVQRSWVWGPEPLAATVEYYRDSPDDSRKLYYFDKGRLDILDEGADHNSDWYASGALLVSEMLSGEIQLGESEFVERDTPKIPLTGDLVQQDPVTYATLAPLSMFADNAPEFESAVGTELTATLSSKGEVDPHGMQTTGIFVGAYSDVTGHNIAQPFVDWVSAQPYPDLYLLGHPVSEPYWIQTQVLGSPKTVLVQAFERRVMTYTPGQSPAWLVEPANVGQHYRLWRGLDQPADPALAPLASGEPFGEELVAAATAANIDPYMLVAISQVVSDGNALMDRAESRGLMGLHQKNASLDPQENAEAGAQELRKLLPSGTNINWKTVLKSFYGSDRQVDETIKLHDELVDTYTAQLMQLEESQPVDAASFGGPLDNGPVAHYDPSYTTDWWEWALTYYQGLGMAAPNTQPDPNGYYCVRPGYMPGEHLRVTANGRTLDCTVGDMVADRDLANWLSKWSIEMNWPMFVALGLDQTNMASVQYPGDWPKSPPPVTAPQPPTNAPAPPVNTDPVNPPVYDPAPPTYEEPAPAPPSVETDTPTPPADESDPTPVPATPTPTPVTPDPTPTPEPEPRDPPPVKQPIPDEPSTPIPMPPTATPTPEPTPEPTTPPDDSGTDDGGGVVAPPPSR